MWLPLILGFVGSELRASRWCRNPRASLVWVGEVGKTDTIISLNAEGELVVARNSPKGFAELKRQSIVGESWAHLASSDRYVFARDDKKIVCDRLVP